MSLLELDIHFLKLNPASFIPSLEKWLMKNWKRRERSEEDITGRLKTCRSTSEDCGSQVDVLFGNDFYWSFFTGDTKQGESGPVTMKTSLGWVLSGPLPQTPGSDTDVHSVSRYTLRLDNSSCGDTVTEKRIYDPQLEEVKNSGS